MWILLINENATPLATSNAEVILDQLAVHIYTLSVLGKNTIYLKDGVTK